MKRVSENRSWQNGYNTLDSINYLLEFFTDSVGNLALVLVVSATRKISSFILKFPASFYFMVLGLYPSEFFDFDGAGRRIISTI